MAEVIIKKWACDACGNIYDERPPAKYPIVKLSYSVQGEWAMEQQIFLNELCDSCSEKVRELMKGLPSGD